MRVVAHSTLLKFAASLKGRSDERVVRKSLLDWYRLVDDANWQTTAQLKQQIRNASIVSDTRVVFNIKGNDYRLVCSINFRRQVAYIKWLGSHADYDKIDARTVQYEN